MESKVRPDVLLDRPGISTVSPSQKSYTMVLFGTSLTVRFRR